MQKNEERIANVVAIGSNGEGIVKDEGLVAFVPFALQNETIKYKALKIDKNCVYAKLIEVISASIDREEPPCPVFYKCGGCQLQHLNYKKQLKVKEEKVKDCFKKIANLDVEVEQTVTGDSQFRYRNKLQLPVGYVNGKNVIGFYAPNSHRIIPITDCLINAEWTGDIIKILIEFMDRYNVKGYDDQTLKGDIREITAKEIEGNLIITVITNCDKLKYSDKLIEMLKEGLAYNFSLYQNVNKGRSNVIFGKDFKLLYGVPEFSSSMLGINYNIGVQSFMQVNTSVCKKLYSKVKTLANITPNTVVIDAYSGAGLMTALLAQNSLKAYGIEIVKEAVDCANQLAKDNGLNHKITNYLGKCEDVLPKIMQEITADSKDTCIIVDPPRKGCEFSVIKAIAESNVDRIIYVSCLPSTLARDVGLLTGALEYQNGQIKRVENFIPMFNVNLVQPFDMFANTKHVETLVMLTRIK